MDVNSRPICISHQGERMVCWKHWNGNTPKFHVVPDVGLWDGPECRNLRIILHNVHVSLSGLRSLHGFATTSYFGLIFSVFVREHQWTWTLLDWCWYGLNPSSSQSSIRIHQSIRKISHKHPDPHQYTTSGLAGSVPTAWRAFVRGGALLLLVAASSETWSSEWWEGVIFCGD